MSFIDEDVNTSQFVDDIDYEHIINDLNKNFYSNLNNNIKNNIDNLLKMINPNSRIKILFANILKQLNVTDEDIFSLISKY